MTASISAFGAWAPAQLEQLASDLSGASDKATWQSVRHRIAATDAQAGPVIAHLLKEGALVLSARAQIEGAMQAFYAAAERPEEALQLLRGLDESLLEKAEGTFPVLEYLAVFARLWVRGAELLRSATLPPTLARQAYLARMLAGETLERAHAEAARQALAELVPHGGLQFVRVAIDRQIRTATPDHVRAALERNLGPDWIVGFEGATFLPAELAGPALAHASLDEVVRALSVYNVAMLSTRTETAARFFEVAGRVQSRDDRFVGRERRWLLAEGIGRAATPDEIPPHAEDALSPLECWDARLARLGTERLDAWALRWLRAPANQGEREAYEHALRRGLFEGLPLGAEVSRILLGVDGPASQVRRREIMVQATAMSPSAAMRLLPIARGLADAFDSSDASVFRSIVAASIAALPAETAIDAENDAYLSIGDARDIEVQRAMQQALLRLPRDRREAVIARSRGTLAAPLDELLYVSAGASPEAMDGFARLVVSACNDESAWVRMRELKTLGPAFGPHLVAALREAAPPPSFLETLEEMLHPKAFAAVKAAAKRPKGKPGRGPSAP